MSEEPHIRRARRADLRDIVRLLADDPLGAGREDSGPALPVAYAHTLEAILADPHQELCVVQRGAEVVGTMQLTRVPGLSRTGSWRLRLEGVRVASRARGGGIGRRMVAHALERAREHGCRIVELTSDLSRARAHEFYRDNGFAATHVGMKLELDVDQERRAKSNPGRSVVYRSYDCFATRRHQGNASAVCIAQELSTVQMQRVAAELRMPTTVFVDPSGERRAAARFFTPEREIGACGHATLAAVAGLVADRWWPTDWDSGVIETGTSAVAARSEGDLTWLSMPLPEDVPVAPEDGALARALACDPATLDARFGTRVVGGGLRHALAQFADLDALRALAPQRAALVALAAELGVDTIGVFADLQHGRVALRDFTAAIGDDEEVASGTTASALAAVLVADRVVPADGSPTRISVEQAPGAQRTGHLQCEVTWRSCGETGVDVTGVRVGGRTVPAGRGVVWLD